VLVKLADEDIGVFMNALDALPPPPLVRLRSLAVAAALPFICSVVKSMVVELAAVAPRTPTAKAALAKHDLKDMCVLLSQISGGKSARCFVRSPGLINLFPAGNNTPSDIGCAIN